MPVTVISIFLLINTLWIIVIKKLNTYLDYYKRKNEVEKRKFKKLRKMNHKNRKKVA